MGLTHSHNLLTEPVTLNRMRYTCQRNSKLPPQVQKFNIELLANDLNKLGFNIRLTDQRGNKLSNEKICNEIYKSRPSVEGICMANNNQVSSAKIVELVKYFNKHFGTNIALTENPMDPDSKRRSIPDLCDDMYMVQDKINRKLSDNADAVKRSLREQIEQLRLQQQILDEAFSRHLNLLRRSPEFGTDMDKIRKQINDVAAMRESLIGELSRQNQGAVKLYTDLESQLASRFQPNITHDLGALAGYYNRSYDGKRGTTMLQVNNLISATKGLGPAIVAYKDCMDKFKITEENLKDDKFDTILEEAIATMDDGMRANLMPCYESLRNSREIIMQSLETDAAFKEFGKAQGLDVVDDGGVILGSEKTEKTGGAVNEDLEDLEDLEDGGRQSFWVNANASESAFVY
jgi:hypothetical protein